MASFTFYVKQGHLLCSDSMHNFAISATSGKSDCMNQPTCSTQKEIGPIPTGRYFLYSAELDDPNILHDIVRNIVYGDWGDWRIRLHPASETATQGRTNLFLHCGFKAGSKGCIDIGGGLTGSTATNLVKESIIRSPKSTLLVI